VIYLVLPVGSFHGWGVCGKYITKELSSITDVRLITENLTEKNISDPLDYYFLKEKIFEPDGIININDPVLQSIVSKFLLPGRPNIRGGFNAGYTFFEENILLPEYIENAKRHFDIVITGCRWCEEVLRGYGLEDVKTIIQGIDPQIFNPANNRKEYFTDRFVIFSGGKFELRKGQDLVIRAFKILQDKHKDVVLINNWYNMWPGSFNTMAASPYIKLPLNENDYITNINNILETNGVDLTKVITLPLYPNTSMARLYKNTDIGLFPNRCEGGTNLVLMEYMACGKPVIASYNTGHRDILTSDNSIMLKDMKAITIGNGKNSVAVWENPNLDEIVNSLEWAYDNRDRLKEIGEQAGKDLSVTTWKRCAEGFYEILNQKAI
jgi:glycosyltransferase involved in cell wall biosynthesis